MNDPIHRQRGLAVLLDALEAELLAAPAADIGEALRDTARARDVLCREVRGLVNKAMTAVEDSPAAAMPDGIGEQAGLHRH